MIRSKMHALGFSRRARGLTCCLLVCVVAPTSAFGENDRSGAQEAAKPARSEPVVSEAAMKHALQQYIDGFNAGDAELLISLFADDATIEDPVGGGRVVSGKDAVRAFYRRAVHRVERLELDAPIRGSHGRSAAMAFTIHLATDDRIERIRTIDVMSFDAAGKIVEMKAFHGPGDRFE